MDSKNGPEMDACDAGTLLKRNSTKVLARVIKIALDPQTDPRVALSAIKQFFDFGVSQKAFDEETRQLRKKPNVRSLSNEQREQLRAILRTMLGGKSEADEDKD